MIHNILIWPDPRLKKISQPLDTFNGSVKELEHDLIETCQSNKGAGLAAIQIGIPSRAMVILDKDQLVFMANPAIVLLDGEEKFMEEGCLSFPGVYEYVKRFERAVAYYKDSAGHLKEIKCDGLGAHAIQHEIDHLDGIVMPDRMDRVKKTRFLKKYKEVK